MALYRSNAINTSTKLVAEAAIQPKGPFITSLHSRSPITPLGSSMMWLRMQGGMKKTATSKSAMARWNRSQLIGVFMALFFNITRHTRELPAILKIIMAARHRTYTKEMVHIALCFLDLKTFLKAEITACSIERKNSLR